MSSAVADLHKAVQEIWAAANLDAVFKNYWSEGDQDEFEPLCEGEAMPAQPHPYCVFRQEDEGQTASRMTGRVSNSRFEIREIPWEFKIFAREFSGLDNNKTAKEIAAELIDYILRTFGGHPTTRPIVDGYSLDNGTLLIATYMGDMPTDEGNYVYSWSIRYKFTLDVPVAA